jgi:hypothetical protein
MDDRRGMDLALQQAVTAARRGDPGFGAIVALGDKVIAGPAVPRSVEEIRWHTTASPLCEKHAADSRHCRHLPDHSGTAPPDRWDSR